MLGHLNVKMYSCSSSYTVPWICVGGTFHDTATAILHDSVFLSLFSNTWSTIMVPEIPFCSYSIHLEAYKKRLRLVQPIFIARLEPRICSTQGTMLTTLSNYHLPSPYAHIIKIFWGGFKPSWTMLCHPTQHHIPLQQHCHESFKSHKSFIL